MIKYDNKSGNFMTTAIGKIASHYYVKHSSMFIYNDNLKPYMNIIDIFRLFSLSFLSSELISYIETLIFAFKGGV